VLAFSEFRETTCKVVNNTFETHPTNCLEEMGYELCDFIWREVPQVSYYTIQGTQNVANALIDPVFGSDWIDGSWTPVSGFRYPIDYVTSCWVNDSDEEPVIYMDYPIDYYQQQYTAALVVGSVRVACLGLLILCFSTYAFYRLVQHIRKKAKERLTQVELNNPAEPSG